MVFVATESDPVRLLHLHEVAQMFCRVERHIRHGSVDQILNNNKLRLADPGDTDQIWCSAIGYRISKMWNPRYRQESTLWSSSLQIAKVFDRISTYLWSKFDIDVLPSYLSVRLPRHVLLPIRYAMVDLFFVCLILSDDMEGFLDDYKILLLRVITTVPMPTLSSSSTGLVLCNTE